MTSEIREVVVSMIKKVNWELLANVITVANFGAFLIDASTLEMRVLIPVS
jgi:hypothetical protein